MSSISQKKDISDPDTIGSFANIVLNTERLDYLYLLTVNDIKATNPALWNGGGKQPSHNAKQNRYWSHADFPADTGSMMNRLVSSLCLFLRVCPKRLH